MRGDSGQRKLRLASAIAAAAGSLLVAATPALAAARDTGGSVYVSPQGSAGAAGTSCGTAAYSTIGAAVAAAPTGGTVVVCAGTYKEDVLVQKPLTLVGIAATIDATGLENAIQVTSSNVTISDFTLENANGEGLLVGVDSLADAGLLPLSGPVLTNVTIARVHAIHDDQGFNGTENGNCKYPGDCGGGIHLNVVENSVVRDSQATGNADGILLTDDYGPNDHNLIARNLVSDNRTECGIVLPSHSSTAVSFDPTTFAVTGRNPDQGGVYDNRVIGNIAIDNGTAPPPPQFGGVGGSGSGIGIFGSGPGSAAYDNVISGNYMAGNGLAGFTIHAHHPGGEDVNGNQVVGNVFDTNNVGGDAFDGGVSDFLTTAIAVYSVPPVQMTIAANAIRNNAIGVWLTSTVNAVGLNANVYRNVGTPVVVQPAN
jgi:nitrous oxidase accessory protein NosD